MIYSMTGYANRNFQLDDTLLQVDIRSVNHRFLDFTLKSPEEFKPIEQEIKEIVSNKISRGKVDFRICIQETSTSNIVINQELLSRYAELSEKIKIKIPNIPESTTAEIICLPGMLVKNMFTIEKVKPIFLKEIETLVSDLLESQMVEGEKLQALLIQKVNQIQNIVNQAIEKMPAVISGYKEKLRLKLQDALSDITVNDQRFQQEFTYYCQKFDVDEELSRLNSHIQQFLHLLENGGMIGKKIDFIIQEMHREANTFGAKSISTATSNYAVELKVLIEQIREQIQNIS